MGSKSLFTRSSPRTDFVMQSDLQLTDYTLAASCAQQTPVLSEISLHGGSLVYEWESDWYYSSPSSLDDWEVHGDHHSWSTVESLGKQQATQSGITYTSEQFKGVISQNSVDYWERYDYETAHYDYSRTNYQIEESQVRVEDKGNRLNDLNHGWFSKILTYIAPLFLLFGWVNFFEALVALAKAENKNYERWMDFLVTGITAIGTTLAFALTVAAVAGFIYAAPYVLGVVLGLGILRRLYYLIKSCCSWGDAEIAANKRISQVERNRHLEDMKLHRKALIQNICCFITNILSIALIACVFQTLHLKSTQSVDASYLSSIDTTVGLKAAQFGNNAAQYLQSTIVDSANSFSNSAFNLMIAIFAFSIPGMLAAAWQLNRDTYALLTSSKKISTTYEAKMMKRIKAVFDVTNEDVPLFFRFSKILFSPIIVLSYGFAGLGHLLLRPVVALTLGGPQALIGYISRLIPPSWYTLPDENSNKNELDKHKLDVIKIGNEIPTVNCLFTSKIKSVQGKIDDKTRINTDARHKHKGQVILLTEVQSIFKEATDHSLEDKDEYDYAGALRKIGKLEALIKGGLNKSNNTDSETQALAEKISMSKDTTYSNVYQNFFKGKNNTQDLVIKAKKIISARQRFFAAKSKQMNSQTSTHPIGYNFKQAS